MGVRVLSWVSKSKSKSKSSKKSALYMFSKATMFLYRNNVDVTRGWKTLAWVLWPPYKIPRIPKWRSHFGISPLHYRGSHIACHRVTGAAQSSQAAPAIRELSAVLHMTVASRTESLRHGYCVVVAWNRVHRTFVCKNYCWMWQTSEPTTTFDRTYLSTRKLKNILPE
jgi:hypothetical protein